MEKPPIVPKQRFIDRAAAIFRQPCEPKFRTVREKLTEGIAKPDQQLFFASFDHLNPAYPDRIITGKLRGGDIVEALKSEKVRGVSIMLDLLSPRSEASLEGGGWSLGLGIVPDELTQLLKDRDTLYKDNTLLVLDANKIIDFFGSGIGTELKRCNVDKHDREIYREQMIGRLGTVLGLYNFIIMEGLRDKLTTSQILSKLHKVMESYLRVDTTWMREVLQSKMSGNVAAALEELATLGHPFWKMPIGEGETLLRFINSEGKEGGKVYHDGSEFVFVDGTGKETKRIPENEIFTHLKDGSVIPSAKLLMATLMVAPEIPHFGNTYGLEQASLDWLGIDGQNLRVNEDDYTDCVPVGRFVLGTKELRSLPVNMLHFSQDRLRELILRTAETGESQFDRKFGQADV